MFRNLPAPRYKPEKASAAKRDGIHRVGGEGLLMQRDSRDLQGVSTGNVRTRGASGFLEIFLRSKMASDGAAMQGIER